MAAYANMKGIKREDDLDFYLQIIPMLDDIWVSEAYKEQEKKQPKRK